MNNWHATIRTFFVCVLLAAVSAASFTTRAQDAEYFWDADPGLGRATSLSISSGADGYYLGSISTADLAPGRHLLGVRLKSHSRWTATHLSYVDIINPDNAIVRGTEYFWDEDPGLGMATPFRAAEVDADGYSSATFSAEGLEPGWHLLGMRTWTDAGWSATHTAAVLITDDSILITGLEYFWDEDEGPGMAEQVAIPPSKEVEIENLEIPFPEYDASKYILSFRAKAGEDWGVTHSFEFENIPLTGLLLDCTELRIAEGTSALLTVTPEPESALFNEYVLESADESIATVDALGNVTGIAPGTTTVSAVSRRYPHISSECLVSVYANQSGTAEISAALIVKARRGGILVETPAPMDVSVVNAAGIEVHNSLISGSRFIDLPAGIYLVSAQGTVRKVAVE